MRKILRVAEEWPELFSEAQSPQPFDITAPNLEIRLAGPNGKKKEFDIIDGEVLFQVKANDDAKDTTVRLIAPVLKSTADQSTFGPVPIDHWHDATEVAIACDQREGLNNTLIKRQLARTDVFCACFEARDGVGNIDKQLSCFRREIPKARVTAPANNDTFYRWTPTVGVKAEVSSGLALTECVWGIYQPGNPLKSFKGEGQISGTSCKVDQVIETSQLANGRYFVAVEATDVAGRMSRSDNLVNFYVRRDIVRLPDRTVRK